MCMCSCIVAIQHYIKIWPVHAPIAWYRTTIEPRQSKKRKSETEFDTSWRNRTNETRNQGEMKKRKKKRKPEQPNNDIQKRWEKKRNTSKTVSKLLIHYNCSPCLIY